MKKYLYAMVICLIAWAPTFATDLPAAPPEAEGFDPGTLAQMQAHFDDYIKNGQLNGYTALVARHGKIVHFNAAGKANIATGAPLTRSSIFRIYSMTKPVTGVALMMLYEEGKFRLEDPLSKYFPAFKNQRVFSGLDEKGNILTEPVKREATIRDLMRHTAGLTYGYFDDTVIDEMYLDTGAAYGLFGYDAEKEAIIGGKPDLKGFVERIAQLPLLYQPGEGWVYSVAVDIQGALIEKLSGMSLDSFFKTRIFDPLGMTHTDFYVHPEWKNRFVELYGFDENRKLIPYRGSFYWDFTKTPMMLSGGAGLVSTTVDYWRFAQMLANEGAFNGVRLLKRETVRLMHQDQLPPDLGGIRGGESGLGFGLDLAVVKDVSERGAKGREGEFFWGGMAGTLFWVDPKEDIVAVMMVNILPGGLLNLTQEMHDYVYSALKE